MMERRIIHITLFLAFALFCISGYRNFLVLGHGLPPEPGLPSVITGRAIEYLPSWATENPRQLRLVMLSPQELGLVVGNADYVYKTGYVYTKFGKVPFDIEGNLIPDSNWLRGNGTKVIYIYPEDFEFGENYAVVYACTKIQDGFDCNDNKWLLGRFNVSRDGLYIAANPEELCKRSNGTWQGCEPSYPDLAIAEFSFVVSENASSIELRGRVTNTGQAETTASAPLDFKINGVLQNSKQLSAMNVGDSENFSVSLLLSDGVNQISVYAVPALPDIDSDLSNNYVNYTISTFDNTVVCTDSDGGLDATRKGRCEDTTGVYLDKCSINNVTEYYCGLSCQSTLLSCAGLEMCSNGACRVPECIRENNPVNIAVPPAPASPAATPGTGAAVTGMGITDVTGGAVQEVSSCGYLGSNPNTVYNLNQDLSSSSTNCLTLFGGENITIDCKGHSIAVPPNMRAMLIMRQETKPSKNITIQNCIVKNGGIVLAGVNNSIIYNNTIEGVGSGVSYATGIQIDRFSAYGAGYSVYIPSFNIEINGNTIKNFSWSGITIRYGGSHSVVNNTLSDNNNGLMIVNSYGNTIVNNTIKNNQQFGLGLQNTDNSSFNDNVLSNNGKDIEIDAQSTNNFGNTLTPTTTLLSATTTTTTIAATALPALPAQQLLQSEFDGITAYIPELKCCEGLTARPRPGLYDTATCQLQVSLPVYAIGGGFGNLSNATGVCVRCGDGICGNFESKCNCPIDCLVPVAPAANATTTTLPCIDSDRVSWLVEPVNESNEHYYRGSARGTYNQSAVTHFTVGLNEQNPTPFANSKLYSEYFDYCRSTSVLREAYCESGLIKYRDVECSNGCFMGRCRPASGPGSCVPWCICAENMQWDSRAGCVPVPYPDLIVSGIVLSNTADMSELNPVFESGGEVYANITFSNIGTLNAEGNVSFVAKLYDNASGALIASHSESFENLPAGNETSKIVSFVLADAGTIVLEAEIDSDADVQESNETNNELSQTFFVLEEGWDLCTDSDGKDYFVKGTTIDDGIEYTDVCSSCLWGPCTHVTEYSCLNDSLVVEAYECPTICIDGACVPETTTTTMGTTTTTVPCVDDADCPLGMFCSSGLCLGIGLELCVDSDGLDNFTKGQTSPVVLMPNTTNEFIGPWEDVCLIDFPAYNEGIYSAPKGITESGGLLEGVCIDELGEVMAIECEYGCSDGRCQLPTTTTIPSTTTTAAIQPGLPTTTTLPQMQVIVNYPTFNFVTNYYFVSPERQCEACGGWFGCSENKCLRIGGHCEHSDGKCVLRQGHVYGIVPDNVTIREPVQVIQPDGAGATTTTVPVQIPVEYIPNVTMIDVSDVCELCRGDVFGLDWFIFGWLGLLKCNEDDCIAKGSHCSWGIQPEQDGMCKTKPGYGYGRIQ
jgi:parallel beta-helix repeat protein